MKNVIPPYNFSVLLILLVHKESVIQCNDICIVFTHHIANASTKGFAFLDFAYHLHLLSVAL